MAMLTTEMKEVPENLKLRVFPSLSPELKGKVKQFRATVTDMNGQIRTPQEEEQRLEKYCSDGDIKNWILVFNNNDLIGMSATFGREITYDEQIVRLGGMGKVRVREDWREKGVATMMMNEAMRELNDLKYDVAFLTTNINSFLTDFYGKYGFVVFKRPYRYVGFSGKSYEERDGMLAQVGLITTFQNIINGKEQLNIGKGKW